MTKSEAFRITKQSEILQSLGFSADEADKLRHISLTLRRWHEMECGTDNGCIERDQNTGRPYWLNANTMQRVPMADRKAGAIKRLSAIINRRNAYGDVENHANGSCTITARKPVSYYIQTDPRGAALYILRKGDIQRGECVESFYTNGICVY